jgi:hypothetical protein
MGMWSNVPSEDPEYDGAYHQAVVDTEKEIFNAATTGEDDDERDNNAALTEDLSQSEGWDGHELSDAEQFHRAAYGDSETGNDRPLQLAAEHELAQENAFLREKNAESQKLINDYVSQPANELIREGQREQVRQHVLDRYGLADLEINNAKLDQFIADMQGAAQHTQMLEQGRVNASMAHAHRQYGRDFEDAYSDLVNMDVNSPLAREIVRNVCSSADPGQKLMEMHGNSIVQSLGPSTPPPFLAPGRRYSAPASRARSAPAESMGGYGDRGTEQDIFDSAVFGD